MDAIKIFVAILPIFILTLYVYVHDKEKEPTSLLYISFIVGVLICIPCIYVENVIARYTNFLQANIAGAFLHVLLSIALVEEGYKYLASFIISYDNKNNNYTFDSIVYCAFVALGFAFFENLLYLKTLSLNSIVLRAFTAVPVHLSCGIMMGYFLSKAKQDIKREKINFLKALMAPVMVHSIYNYYLVYITSEFRIHLASSLVKPVTYTLLILILVVLFLFSHYLLVASAMSDKKIKKKKTDN